MLKKKKTEIIFEREREREREIEREIDRSLSESRYELLRSRLLRACSIELFVGFERLLYRNSMVLIGHFLATSLCIRRSMCYYEIDN